MCLTNSNQAKLVAWVFFVEQNKLGKTSQLLEINIQKSLFPEGIKL